MSAEARGPLLDAVDAERDQMLRDLVDLAEIETPSQDLEGCQRAISWIGEAASRDGLISTHVPGQRSAGVMTCVSPAPGGRHLQLLVGHVDTVWPLGTTSRRGIEVTDDRVSGPGTYDMKAGLVQALAAFRALSRLGWAPQVTPLLLVNSDEEIGSRDSRRAIEAAAAVADRAFVLEPSLGPEGLLKTARKGLGRYTITVHGKAAHAGLEPGQGASAIQELSHVIAALFALNDPEHGTSVNVGTIEGGIQPNVVAPRSSAIVDVRALTAADAERVDAAIRAITPQTPGTRIEVDGHFGRPPMEATAPNSKLFELARRTGANLGLTIGSATAGGGSDGNTTSQYTATLDGMGAVGAGAHAEHEQVDIEGWVERTALLAGLLLLPPMTTRRVADPALLLTGLAEEGER